MNVLLFYRLFVTLFACNLSLIHCIDIKVME